MYIHYMYYYNMKFVWDEKKSSINLAKHKASFREIRIISARKATKKEKYDYQNL